MVSICAKFKKYMVSMGIPCDVTKFSIFMTVAISNLIISFFALVDLGVNKGLLELWHA